MAKIFLQFLVLYVIILLNAGVLSNAQHQNGAAVAAAKIKINQSAAADADSISQLTRQNYNATHTVTTETTTKDVNRKNSSSSVNNKFMNEYNASDDVTNNTVSSSSNEHLNAEEKQSMKNLNSISMKNSNLSMTADLNVSHDDTFQLYPLEMSDLNANQADLSMSNVESSPSASTPNVFDADASDENGILTNGDGRLSRDIGGGGGGNLANTNILNTRNIYKIAKAKPKTLATPTKKIDISGDGEEEEEAEDIDITEEENRLTYTPSILSSTTSSSVMETLKFYGVNQSAEYFKSNLNIFQIITELYDQSQWKIDEIIKGVDDRQCGADMTAYITSLNLAIPWAIKASDASGRYRGQFFFGNDFWMGSKLFCSDINSNYSDVGYLSKQTPRPVLAFFIAKILMKINDPIKQNHLLHLGQCLPKSCSLVNIEKILKLDPTANLLMAPKFNKTVSMTFVDVRPIPGDYSLWNDCRFYIFTTICIFLAILIVIATIRRKNSISTTINKSLGGIVIKSNSKSFGRRNSLSRKFTKEKHLELHQITQENNNIECETNRKKSLNNKRTDTSVPQQLLQCFDLVSNTQAIMSTKKLPEDSVSCIHGLRTISMFWTIMVHTYLQMFGIAENRFGRIITERNFSYQLIANATFTVDTFFFISGLLVTLLFLRNDDKKHARESRPSSSSSSSPVKSSTLECILLITYRYLRLTPSFFAVLFLNELALKYTYNRSVFTPGLVDHLTCPNYWWRNLLYVQTWFPFSQLCMVWSWYLANDMQFYVWAVITLIIARRYLKTAVTIVFSFLLISWVTSALISIKFGYVLRVSEPLESFGFLYDRPWTRLGPYIMGIMTGYILHRVQQPPKIPRAVNCTLWLISIVTMFLLVFGIWNGKLSIIATAIYVSLGHTAWGFALIWITLSCKWGLCKPVNQFLSYQGFLPLSRLTYCTYLIHPVTQIIVSFQMEGAMHIEHSMILTIFLGNALFSYACAFVISLMFEAPVVRILRIIFRRKRVENVT